jgi:hypothetical protein
MSRQTINFAQSLSKITQCHQEYPEIQKCIRANFYALYLEEINARAQRNRDDFITLTVQAFEKRNSPKFYFYCEERLDQDLYAVLVKSFICCHNADVMQECRGDDEAVTGVSVDRRKLGCPQTYVGGQIDRRDSVMLHDSGHPSGRRCRQLQLAGTVFDADFKGSYGRDIGDRRFIDQALRFL